MNHNHPERCLAVVTAEMMWLPIPTMYQALQDCGVGACTVRAFRNCCTEWVVIVLCLGSEHGSDILYENVFKDV